MRWLVLYLFMFFSFPLIAQIDYGGLGLMPTDSCDFETPCNRLYIDTINSNNNWQVGSTNKPFFGQASSLPNAIMTDTINSYSANNLSYFDLTFSAWDGSGFPFDMYIKFDHKYETDTLIDGGYISVSHDSGQTFHNIIFDSTNLSFLNAPFVNSDNLYTINDSLANGEFGFSGTSDWKTTIVQWQWMFVVKQTQTLSDYLIVRFNFISDSIQTNKDGWIIDNIQIGEVDFGSSVEEFSNDIKVNLYPNLTSNDFNYQIENSVILESIIITNITGATILIKTNPNPSGKIDISHLPSGNYFVKFSSTTSSIVKRIVKN